MPAIAVYDLIKGKQWQETTGAVKFTLKLLFIYFLQFFN